MARLCIDTLDKCISCLDLRCFPIGYGGRRETRCCSDKSYVCGSTTIFLCYLEELLYLVNTATSILNFVGQSGIKLSEAFMVLKFAISASPLRFTKKRYRVNCKFVELMIMYIETNDTWMTKHVTYFIVEKTAPQILGRFLVIFVRPSGHAKFPSYHLQ